MDSSDGFLEGELEDDSGSLEGELEQDDDGFLEDVDLDNEDKGSDHPPSRKSIGDDLFKQEHWKDEYVDRTGHTSEISAGMKKVKCACGDHSCIPKRQRWTTCPGCNTTLIDFGWESHHPESMNESH